VSPNIDRLVWNDGASDYEDLWVEEGTYPNGTMALTLHNTEYGPIATITTNLQAYDILPGRPWCFFIKNYSENEGLGYALVGAGVVQRTGRKRVWFGPYSTSADEYRLTDRFKKEMEH
jgi:hypothetical protein